MQFFKEQPLNFDFMPKIVGQIVIYQIITGMELKTS